MVGNARMLGNQGMDGGGDVYVAPDCYRARCTGELPLDAKIESWMQRVLLDGSLDALVKDYGSPINIVNASTMRGNIAELSNVADQRGVNFQVFFARKSNKCVAFVDEAKRSNAGVDAASENEIRQSLGRGIPPEQIICTAAVKDELLINFCLQHGVCIVIDNFDELDLVSGAAKFKASPAVIALRIGGFQHEGERLWTRFGFDVNRDASIVERLSQFQVEVRGIHFHLDGYDAAQRVTAIRESIAWVERLQMAGHRPKFIDIGGGFPINYLDSENQWNVFWHEHERALLGLRRPITYRNHGLGCVVVGGKIHGTPKCYPFYQSPTRGEWFASILDADAGGNSIAEAFRTNGIQLRCEPGRSLMDGCGMTVARVEFRKQNASGDWLIGLSMNRTQCRTSSDDFLIDPIVVSKSGDTAAGITGYLVGAYCTESELLSLRRLHFPLGIQRGDLVVFPNTAGYFMHFLESRSHQFPLAKNVLITDDSTTEFALDPIDETQTFSSIRVQP